MIYVMIAIYTIFCIGVLLLLYRQMVYSHKTTPEDFSEYLAILNALIRTELLMYENNVFNEKGPITNNNFDSYYKDLCSKIISNIPEELFKKMKDFYTQDAIYKMIARSVQAYLVSKIQ